MKAIFLIEVLDLYIRPYMKNLAVTCFLTCSFAAYSQPVNDRVVAKTSCALVQMVVATPHGEQTLMGTVVDMNGYILTTADAIRTAERIAVNFPDGSIQFARIYSAYNPSDAAMLKVADLPRETCSVKLATSEKTNTDRPFYLPDGSSLEILDRVQQKGTDGSVLVDYFKLSPHSAPDGSPLFDSKARLVGVYSDTLSSADYSAGVTADLVHRVLFEEHSFWLGVTTEWVTPDQVSGLHQSRALMITELSHHSSLTYNGLRQGDIILSIGSINLADFTSFEEIYKYFLRKNGIMTIRYQHDGREHETEVDLNQY